MAANRRRTNCTCSRSIAAAAALLLCGFCRFEPPHTLNWLHGFNNNNDHDTDTDSSSTSDHNNSTSKTCQLNGLHRAAPPAPRLQHPVSQASSSALGAPATTSARNRLPASQQDDSQSVGQLCDGLAMSSWAEMQYTKIEVSTGSIKGKFCYA